MKLLRRIQLVSLAMSLALAGCRAAQPKVEATSSLVQSQAATSSSLVAPAPAGAEQLPASINNGAYPSAPSGIGAPPLVAQQSAAGSAPCPAEPAKPKRRWTQWLPNTTPNDPTRERGQFTDGWYEPEYRGISD